MAFGNPSLQGVLTRLPKIPQAPAPTYTQDQVNASLAANPYAAGSNGSYFQGNLTGATVPGQSSGGGGFTMPDFASLINSDPIWAQLQQQVSASGIANAAQRAAATNRALIQFGMVPDFAKAAASLGLSPDALNFLQQDVTPEITQLANQNTTNGLSTEARLQQAQQNAVRNLRNSLAARGALSSGEANYALNNEQQQYAQSQQDALNKLMDVITGYQNSYLQGQQAAQNQLSTGLMDAYQRQLQLFLSGMGGYGGGGGAPSAPGAPAPAAPAAPEFHAQAPIVATTVGIPGANQGAMQAGRLGRINSLM